METRKVKNELPPHCAAQTCLSVNDVATLLGVSRSTVWSRISSKDLPSLKIGSRRLVRSEDLTEYLRARAQ